MIALEDLFKGTGTEFGSTFYANASTCHARGVYTMQARAENAVVEDSEEDDNLSLGTAYHALKKLFALKQYDQFIPKLSGGEDLRDGIVKEAMRLADAHNARYPLESYGEILAVEEPFEMRINGAKYTGQADLIIKLSEEDCTNWFKTRGVILPGAGVYLLDYKTSGARKKTADFYYKFSPQFMLYSAAIQELHPDWNVRGCIGDIIIKHKELKNESFQHVFSGIPNAETYGYLKDWVWNIDQALKLPKLNHNPTACVDYMTHRPCPHLASGRCAYALSRGLSA